MVAKPRRASAAHTAGPWAVKINGNGRPYPAAADGPVFNPARPPEELLANAHLTSGALDLLDFAKAAVVAFDLAAELMPENAINFAQFAIDARAAIVKACANG